MSAPSPEERVFALVRGARRLAAPDDPLGVEALRVLPASTGLSPEGVALALAEHFETRPTADEVRRLVASVVPAPRAHVVLSASVFTASLRAVALALASSPVVFVRPSRREPEMVQLLARAAEFPFSVVSELDAHAGDVVFAYGRDETIDALRAGVPAGVHVVGHGTGFGVVVIEVDTLGDDALRDAAGLVARDVVPFDQRGCLSPRVVCCVGSRAKTRAFAERLASALAALEQRVPIGRLDDAERAAARAYRDTMAYAGESLDAGSGSVGLDLESGSVVLSPVGRHVHVTRTDDVPSTLSPLGGLVVSAGVSGSARFHAIVRSVVPGARIAPLGFMQRPPFDGPVDGRSGASAHTV